MPYTIHIRLKPKSIWFEHSTGYPTPQAAKKAAEKIRQNLNIRIVAE